MNSLDVLETQIKKQMGELPKVTVPVELGDMAMLLGLSYFVIDLLSGAHPLVDEMKDVVRKYDKICNELAVR